MFLYSHCQPAALPQILKLLEGSSAKEELQEETAETFLEPSKETEATPTLLLLLRKATQTTAYQNLSELSIQYRFERNTAATCL
ncbi:hypothetical protein CHL76_06905 [Marinococcus halophilus]|nr:hypothetical protein CHL76_06905 [Marinococcus halophilus]